MQIKLERENPPGLVKIKLELKFMNWQTLAVEGKTQQNRFPKTENTEYLPVQHRK